MLVVCVCVLLLLLLLLVFARQSAVPNVVVVVVLIVVILPGKSNISLFVGCHLSSLHRFENQYLCCGFRYAVLIFFFLPSSDYFCLFLLSIYSPSALCWPYCCSITEGWRASDIVLFVGFCLVNSEGIAMILNIQ